MTKRRRGFAFYLGGKPQTVRLACRCGRNLADVRLVVEDVWAFPRPGVHQAEHGGTLAHPGTATLRWDCRCGRTWEIRGDRLDAVWREHARIGRTVRLILGHDVL